MQQQHWLRETSVAAMMAPRPSAAESALILQGVPTGIEGAFARLPARKAARR